MRYVTAAPTAKQPTFAFHEIGILFKNNKTTTVKIRRLSMPAHGHATPKAALLSELFGSVAVNSGKVP